MKRSDLLALAREDLAVYVRAFMPSFELTAHHRLLLEKLEAVEAGRLRRLIVCMPPRHGKSIVGSQFFPGWYLGRNPWASVICASYGQELADDFGRKVRNLVGDPLHEAIFAECKMSDDSTAAHRFNLTGGGAFYAVGRGGSATGRGADLVVVDDPLKDLGEALSDAVRKELHDWFGSVILTRLSPRGAVVLIQTRWHQDDLAGRLLRERGDEWELLSLPAVSEGEGDALGRPEGAALWTERFGADVLARIKSEIGSAAWASLYQQRPAPIEGAMFKQGWWRYYDPATPPSVSRVTVSLDTAFQAKKTADYSAGTVWGESTAGFYLLDAWRDRVEFPELKRKVVALAERWRPHAVLIEDRASGQSLVQELKAGTTLPILPIRLPGDKIARAAAVTPTVESGRVWLPKGAPWLDEVLTELSTFPASRNDDYVDSLTQYLNWARGKGPAGEWLHDHGEASLSHYAGLRGAY